jgi:hypothetical protein
MRQTQPERMAATTESSELDSRRPREEVASVVWVAMEKWMNPPGELSRRIVVRLFRQLPRTSDVRLESINYLDCCEFLRQITGDDFSTPAENLVSRCEHLVRKRAKFGSKTRQHLIGSSPHMGTFVRFHQQFWRIGRFMTLAWSLPYRG